MKSKEEIEKDLFNFSNDIHIATSDYSHGWFDALVWVLEENKKEENVVCKRKTKKGKRRISLSRVIFKKPANEWRFSIYL